MIEFIKKTFPYIKPYWVRGLIGVLLAIPMAGIKAAQAYLLKPLFDKGLSSTSTFDDALYYAIIFVGFALLNYPIRFLHYYYIKGVCEKGICSLRERINQTFQRLPLKFYSTSKQGELMSIAMNDTLIVSNGFKFAVDLIREPLTALGLFGVLLYNDWQLTLVFFAIVPVILMVMNFTGKWVKHYESELREQMGLINHEIAETIQGQKIIKAFNLQSFVDGRFKKSLDKYLFFWKRYARVEENAHPLIELLSALGFSAVILFAHSRIVSGELTNGGFLSFIGSLVFLSDPIRRLSDAVVRLNQARASGDRVYRIIDTPLEIDEGNEEIQEFKERLEFKNVTFSYGEGDVLKDFNLSVEKGQRVALVGLSGSGKSTLVNLILRLYDIEKGEILIDSKPIQKIKMSSLRSLFSLVSQDVFLFNDTVKENLLVGDNHSEGELEQALEVSYAKEFTQKLPGQLETQIGDRGTRLSGGQSQRITIARAFLKDTPILLFDEATSALDNESEKIVQKALDEVAGNKTVIAIAHRLSTIQNYDKIVVMNEGRKIEEGTHEELIALRGEYFKLYELSKRD